MKHLNTIVLTFLFFTYCISAKTETAPFFPFTDWSKLKVDSKFVAGSEAPCGPNQTKMAVGYFIEKNDDSMWRLFGPIHFSDSLLWVGMHLNVNAIPDWIYFGKTEGNIMHLERMEKYNSELHSDICSLIF